MSEELAIKLKCAVITAIEENTGLSFGELFQAGLEFRLRRDGKLSEDHWALWTGRIPPQGAAETAAAIEIARSQNAVLMQDVVALKAKLHDAENAPCAACATRVQHTDANPCDLAIGLKEELAASEAKRRELVDKGLAMSRTITSLSDEINRLNAVAAPHTDATAGGVPVRLTYLSNPVRGNYFSTEYVEYLERTAYELRSELFEERGHIKRRDETIAELRATCIDHERDLKMLREQPPEEVKKLRESNEALTRERDLAMRECDDLRAQRDRARHEAVEATINVERLTNERDALKAAAEAPEERSFYIELAGDQVKVTLARMKT